MHVNRALRRAPAHFSKHSVNVNPTTIIIKATVTLSWPSYHFHKCLVFKLLDDLVPKTDHSCSSVAKRSKKWSLKYMSVRCLMPQLNAVILHLWQVIIKVRITFSKDIAYTHRCIQDLKNHLLGLHTLKLHGFHSFSNYLANACYVPSSVLASENTIQRCTRQTGYSLGLYILGPTF